MIGGEFKIQARHLAMLMCQECVVVLPMWSEESITYAPEST